MTITNNVVAKLSVAFVTVAMLFTMVAPAQAQSAAELQAMIDTLLKQVAALQAQAGGSTSASCTFTRSLTTGSQGADVTCLQNYLIKGGYSIPAGATGYFGAQTVAAVSAWQAANGVSPAAGYFGPVSQAKFTAMGGGSTGGNNNGGSTGGDLEGNAGSITWDDSSEFSSEEVGENEEDVEVMEFSIEADDESDVEVTSVKVEFVESGSTSSEDLTDYAESVSVWFGGEKVGEADAEDFSESSDVYTKTISLDDSIIRAGEEEEFVIAVTALSNLDSGDIDSDAWTVDVIDVRFVDGDGVTTTENTDDNPDLSKTFDFSDFASAADLELKISGGDDEINDARVIGVDATDTTDDVELLSFMAEAEGDSDITINDLPVVLTTTEAAGTDFDEPGDVVTTLYLYADGEEIGSESLSGASSGGADSQTVTFEEIEYTIDAGEEIEFIVKAKLVALSGALDAGDTISADLTSTERDLIDAEDESGEDLGTGDMTGTATGGTHVVYENGIEAELVSVTETEVAGDGNDDDYVTLAIKFDVTSFGDDVYVDKSVSEAGTSTNGTAFGVDLSDAQGSYISAASTTFAFSSTADEGTNGYEVEEGETETFTLTVTVQNAATSTFDGKYVRAILTGIGFNTDDSSTFSTYTSNLTTDFKTDFAFIAN